MFLWLTPVNHGESLSQKVNHPVRGVSWSQADQYCRWAGKRLPTIAQWERAARGTMGGVHPWGAVFRGGSFSSGDEQAEPWLGYFPDGTIYHERRKSKIGLRCARSP